MAPPGERSVDAFTAAARLDPTNEAAKVNLEIALRALAPQGTRTGSNPGPARAARAARAPAPASPGGGTDCRSRRIVFLTPLAGLLALLAIVPLGAFVLAERRLRAARAQLGLLPPPGAAARLRRAVALAAVPVAARARGRAAGAAAPGDRAARTDAAAFVVLDVSRSMAAAPGTAAQASRLARARTHAHDLPRRRLRAARRRHAHRPRAAGPVPDGGSGRRSSRWSGAVGLEDPPPRETSVTATAFGALGALGSQGFFDRAIRHRVLVLVTDGESRPFDAARWQPRAAGRAGRAASSSRGWATAATASRGPRGAAEPYRPDPSGAAASVPQLAQATARPGRAGPRAPPPARRAQRGRLGSDGRGRASSPTTDTLAPFVALAGADPAPVSLWPEMVGSVPVLQAGSEGGSDEAVVAHAGRRGACRTRSAHRRRHGRRRVDARRRLARVRPQRRQHAPLAADRDHAGQRQDPGPGLHDRLPQGRSRRAPRRAVLSRGRSTASSTSPPTTTTSSGSTAPPAPSCGTSSRRTPACSRTSASSPTAASPPATASCSC